MYEVLSSQINIKRATVMINLATWQRKWGKQAYTTSCDQNSETEFSIIYTYFFLLDDTSHSCMVDGWINREKNLALSYFIKLLMQFHV